MGYIFISYSRKQLYFAESLVSNLQRNGIDTWFDLQDLEIGSQWAKSLENAYSNCDKLILIASEAALASPYVQAEWKKVRRSGKQIIIVLYETIALPNSLRNMPVFDFRMGFRRKLSRLIKYLKGETEKYDRYENKKNLLMKLSAPAIIWMGTLFIFGIVLTFFLFSILFFIGNETYFSQETASISTFSGFSIFILAYIGLPLKKLWSHNISQTELKRMATVSGLLLLSPISFLLLGESVVGEEGIIGTAAVILFILT